MQFNWKNKYQQFLSIHVRYTSLSDPISKAIDLLQKNFFAKDGKIVSFERNINTKELLVFIIGPPP